MTCMFGQFRPKYNFNIILLRLKKKKKLGNVILTMQQARYFVQVTGNPASPYFNANPNRKGR